MTTFTISSSEAKFLADCIAARTPAQHEAIADSVTPTERARFIAMLDMGKRLHLKFTIGAYASDRHKLERSAG